MAPSFETDEAKAAIAKLTVPQHYDDVYKDECIYSFVTPFHEKGLYVNLRYWHAVSTEFLQFDSSRTDNRWYLHQKFKKIPITKEEPTKLAIGVEGGFGKEYEVEKSYWLHVANEGDIEIPADTIISKVCEGIMNHAGNKIKDAGSWEAEQEIKVTKYAKDLIQLDSKTKISPNPKDWVCAISGDKENLWLNLSDGFIGGGRKNWDGSGGSNGALDHYHAEKSKGNNYPLAVKLGTITADGGDVFSYAEDENDIVRDPLLKEHLAHWGIDVMKMEKTQKTVAELELHLNMNYDWTRICESGEKLEAISGPGYVGLLNLGNTCYMNSTLQMISSVDEFSARYVDEDAELRKSAGKDAPKDLSAQLARLVNGIRHPPDDCEDGLEPSMLRSVVVKRHPEFSTNRQQDAAEFFSYFIDQVTRSEKSAGHRLKEGKSLQSLFEFKMEERIQNRENEVCYQTRNELYLSLPMHREDGKEEPEAKRAKVEEPMLVIPFDVSLQRFFSLGALDNFRGSPCTMRLRMASMPKYIVVQLQRYYIDEKWCPAKLVCSCPAPETLDLERFRAKGKQSDEVEMAGNAEFEPDPTICESLEAMGFSRNGAIKACKATKNAGSEQAMEYVLAHMEDPGFNDPEAGGVDADHASVEMLVAMGFTESRAKKALKACDNNMERAADWLFSHTEDVDEPVEELSDGPGQYRLKGFISHIGRHPSHGHYVCHLKKEGQWVIYDDSKVAKSSQPPLDLGYLYLYERI